MNDSTEVMPLDELMDLAAEPRPAATTQPHAAAAAPVAPAAPPQLSYPASGAQTYTQQPRRTEPSQMQLLTRRMRADAQRASATAMTRARHWLESNDNVLIVATVLITLLLLVFVAAL